MVPAMMAKLQLKSFSTERNANQLMSQANAKDRLPTHQPANAVHGICTRLRITRSIRQKNSVRLQRQNILGQSLRRNHSHPTSFTTQLTQNVLFNTEIISRS